MTLDQLKIFVEVADRGHVTRAAKALGLSQSTVSSAIANLEGNYEIRLFDRVGRGIRLTGNGKVFLREARAVLNRAAMAKSALQDLAGHPGPVAIGASQTIAAHWLPRRLATFHAANPLVRLDVVIGNTHDIETAVVEGRVDVGLVEGPTEHPSLVRRHIDYDQLVLVVASNQPSPVYGQGELDLRAINWVIREAGSGTRRGLEDLALLEGLSLNDLSISLVLPANEAIREAIEAGAGATIISRHVVASAIEEGRLREIPIELPNREYALVLHRERHMTVAVRELINRILGDANQTNAR
ncbi:MAG: LysR substrate-binding domain-containing protein [Hyphomicrobiales bacterium]